MELKDRLQKILTEQNIKRKELAEAIKVTESYISNILTGRRQHISESLALLIEQKYSYSARWLLTGEGDCHVSLPAASELSHSKKIVIAKIAQMSDTEVEAVNVFINSLDQYKKAFCEHD